jgi:hypothetical protein
VDNCRADRDGLVRWRIQRGIAMLTLEEFCATRTKVNDLGTYLGIGQDDSAQRSDYTYAEDCYLIICGQGRRPNYYRGIGPNERTSVDCPSGKNGFTGSGIWADLRARGMGHECD